MSSLSIVVPRIGTNDHFEATLASVLRYRMPHHQVVVVQSDLQADTYGLEDEVDFVEVEGRPGLARYLNEVVPGLNGRVVNVILPGVEVTHHWFAQGIRRLQNEAVGSVSCVLVSADYRDEVISCGLLTNRGMVPRHASEDSQRPLGPCRWAGFYRKDVLVAIGSLDETLGDEFIALDLAFSIRAMGLRCAVGSDRALTIADANLLRISNRQQTGRDAQRMVQRHMTREQQRLGSVVAVGSDMLSSFWRPSRWAQVAGRFAARSKQATDRAFSRRLSLAKHELNESGNAPQRKAA